MTMPTLASTEPVLLQRLIFGDKMPASHAAAWSDGLFLLITWFSIFFFVVLMALMVYFVIKYRRRPGVPAQPSPHHNTLLEIFWTVVPSSSMLVMFVYGFWGYSYKIVSPDNAMELHIRGMKWAWIATYPNGATSPEKQTLSKVSVEGAGPIQGLEYPIFYIPEDTDVKLLMQSADVLHSFWIPEFRTKMDVVPNRYTGYGFHTPTLTSNDSYVHQKTGEVLPGRDMWIFCAEYCGDDHSRMAATLRVVPREVYDQKMAEWGVKLDPIDAGHKIWNTICKSCHQIDGTRLVGPAWNSFKNDTGEFGFGYEAVLMNGSKVLRDDNYYRESILDPNAKVVKGFAPAMTSYQGILSDEDIDNVIAFIKSLSDRDPNAGEHDATPDQPESQAEESAGSES
jgi:cytochrome c oxidase subunit II